MKCQKCKAKQNMEHVEVLTECGKDGWHRCLNCGDIVLDEINNRSDIIPTAPPQHRHGRRPKGSTKKTIFEKVYEFARSTGGKTEFTTKDVMKAIGGGKSSVGESLKFMTYSGTLKHKLERKGKGSKSYYRFVI